MRCVFVFMTSGGAPQNVIPAWNPKGRAKNKYLEEGGLPTEGTYWMLKKMKQKGIVDDILLIIESSKHTGRFYLEKNLGFVIPHISCLDQLLRSDDVLFIRGGFRGWHDWLKSKKGKHWLMLYGANTGREKWPFWDVILNDLDTKMETDQKGRLWFPFRKPINPEIFKFEPQSILYDFCIGASYIHDKKGQWRFIEVLKHWKDNKPRCIMPGAVRHSIKTNRAIKEAVELGVEMPGMVSRTKLNTILNRSKFFVHLGTSGQNDRGPLEAMRCGCRLVIASPQYHSPYVNYLAYIPKDKDDYKDICVNLKNRLKTDWLTRKTIFRNYENNLGEDIVLGDMSLLFYQFRNSNPKEGLKWKP